MPKGAREEGGKWGIYCQQRSFRKCQFRFYGIKCLGSLCGLLSQSGFQVLSSSLPLTLVSFCIMRRQQQFRLLCQRFLNVICRLHQYNLIYREMKCQSSIQIANLKIYPQQIRVSRGLSKVNGN